MILVIYQEHRELSSGYLWHGIYVDIGSFFSGVCVSVCLCLCGALVEFIHIISQYYLHLAPVGQVSLKKTE